MHYRCIALIPLETFPRNLSYCFHDVVENFDCKALPLKHLVIFKKVSVHLDKVLTYFISSINSRQYMFANLS